MPMAKTYLHMTYPYSGDHGLCDGNRSCVFRGAASVAPLFIMKGDIFVVEQILDSIRKIEAEVSEVSCVRNAISLLSDSLSDVPNFSP